MLPAVTYPRGQSPGLRPAGRAERLAEGPAAMFAYGTLQFAEVLRVLLDRVPVLTPGAVAGWRAAALAGRVYPGLVQADGEVTGVLITGLTRAELRLIDEYESGPYELERLTLTDGRDGWTYAWTDHAEVLAHNWSPRSSPTCTWPSSPRSAAPGGTGTRPPGGPAAASGGRTTRAPIQMLFPVSGLARQDATTPSRPDGERLPRHTSGDGPE
jgi:gamma-glutamylcyclotransferase (GGCT)/AIG2-like uncharacterized protein YtfP